MKNFYLKSMMAVLVALFSLNSNAEVGDEFIENNLWYWVTSESPNEVCLRGARGGDEPLTTLVVPATVNFNGQVYDVTSVDADAFWWSSSLTSVSFAEGSKLTSVGGYAFAQCTALTSITLPDGLTSIGEVAFQGCINLTSITIPASVESIGQDAFYGCI